jgi:NAD(P)H-flavin reductase
VLIAGGIGVTPFRGMARYATDIGAQERIVLLYSARVPEEFVFRHELDALAASHPQFRVHYTVTRPAESNVGWEGRTGRITEDWIAEHLRELTRPKVYVVGLPGMAEELLESLRDRMGIPEDDLEYEYFRGY